MTYNFYGGINSKEEKTERKIAVALAAIALLTAGFMAFFILDKI